MAAPGSQVGQAADGVGLCLKETKSARNVNEDAHEAAHGFVPAAPSHACSVPVPSFQGIRVEIERSTRVSAWKWASASASFASGP